MEFKVYYGSVAGGILKIGCYFESRSQINLTELQDLKSFNFKVSLKFKFPKAVKI
jgi:hypothetical protein